MSVDYYQPLSHTVVDPNAVPPPPSHGIPPSNGLTNNPPPHTATGIPTNPPPPAGYAPPPPAPHATLPPSTPSVPSGSPYGSSYETMDYHTIIVEGLPQQVTDPDLRHFFSPYGSIDSIIITPRNPSSPPDPDLTAGGDMEAMIKFLQRESALSVVNTLAGAEYYGFRLKISYATAGQVEARKRATAPPTVPPSQPPSAASAPLDYNAYLASATQNATPPADTSTPSSYPPPSSGSSRPMNIYLANVPQNWTRTELENFFGPRYGRILECKVLPGRGIGFILFEREEDGKRCLEESKGIVLDGAPGALVARMTRLPPHVEGGGQGGPSKRPNSYQGHRYNPMYAGGRGGGAPYNNYGYPPATPQYPPAQYPPAAAIPGADPYAMYNNPAAMQYPPAGAPAQPYPAATPFGYPGAQQPAYAAYPGAPVYGGYPTPAMPSGPSFAGGGRGRGRGRGRPADEPYMGDPNRDVALFVFHIPNSLNENALRDLFGQYGRVVNVAINRDKTTGEARGYGFVTMGNLEEARNCIQFLNGYHQDNKYLKVTLKQAK